MRLTGALEHLLLFAGIRHCFLWLFLLGSFVVPYLIGAVGLLPTFLGWRRCFLGLSLVDGFLSSSTESLLEMVLLYLVSPELGSTHSPPEPPQPNPPHHPRCLLLAAADLG